MRSTKSHSPPSPPVTAPSRISVPMRSTSSWRARTAFGVKRPLTTRRIGTCRGGSSITTISGIFTTGCSARASVIPYSLEKRAGWRAISMMSACFVIAQNGL